jgi:hypothetical protein
MWDLLRKYFYRLTGWARKPSNLEGNYMSDYTKEMESVIRNAAPLTFEAAQEIAQRDEFIAASKTHRSVIAKAKSMGIEYVPKAPATKKPKGETKADLVSRIAVATGLDSESLTGLDKANTSALRSLLTAVS